MSLICRGPAGLFVAERQKAPFSSRVDELNQQEKSLARGDAI